MDKRRIRNIVAILVGGLGLLFVACAVSPNFVSDWFAAGDTDAGFAIRGGLLGALLLCTALVLAFLRVEGKEEAAKPKRAKRQKVYYEEEDEEEQFDFVKRPRK